MNSWEREAIFRLTIPERLQLVEDIWDSIADTPEELPLTESQRAALDRRLDAYHRNPDEGAPWAEVRKRIQERK